MGSGQSQLLAYTNPFNAALGPTYTYNTFPSNMSNSIMATPVSSTSVASVSMESPPLGPPSFNPTLQAALSQADNSQNSSVSTPVLVGTIGGVSALAIAIVGGFLWKKNSDDKKTEKTASNAESKGVTPPSPDGDVSQGDSRPSSDLQDGAPTEAAALHGVTAKIWDPDAVQKAYFLAPAFDRPPDPELKNNNNRLALASLQNGEWIADEVILDYVKWFNAYNEKNRVAPGRSEVIFYPPASATTMAGIYEIAYDRSTAEALRAYRQSKSKDILHLDKYMDDHKKELEMFIRNVIGEADAQNAERMILPLRNTRWVISDADNSSGDPYMPEKMVDAAKPVGNHWVTLIYDRRKGEARIANSIQGSGFNNLSRGIMAEIFRQDEIFRRLTGAHELKYVIEDGPYQQDGFSCGDFVISRTLREQITRNTGKVFAHENEKPEQRETLRDVWFTGKNFKSTAGLVR
jgi:hypothetical protein